MRRRGWGVTSLKSYSELFRSSECIVYNRADFMAITIGQQLGSYEITALLGKGGMGEVYRARDSKLGRDVAIKILQADFAGDPDRLARFEREAHILASLNHPNIGAIYDLEEVNGSRFLVLELVEGETLAERIARGPIPIGEALTIAKQTSGSSGGRTRTRHCASRSEARKRQDHSRRKSEGA